MVNPSVKAVSRIEQNIKGKFCILKITLWHIIVIFWYKVNNIDNMIYA